MEKYTTKSIEFGNEEPQRDTVNIEKWTDNTFSIGMVDNTYQRSYISDLTQEDLIKLRDLINELIV